MHQYAPTGDLTISQLQLSHRWQHTTPNHGTCSTSPITHLGWGKTVNCWQSADLLQTSQVIVETLSTLSKGNLHVLMDHHFNGSLNTKVSHCLYMATVLHSASKLRNNFL